VTNPSASAAKVAALFTAAVLASAACASGTASTGRSVPSATASTSTPFVSAAPSASAAATPIAILDGEPWITYEWFQLGKDTKDLFLARPDGSDAHVIATDVPGSHYSPSWSPDGRRIAFVVRDTATPEGSIWTANADGSGAALLSAGGDTCPVGLFHPSWSPEGTKLAVVCYPGGPVTESVAIMDVATKAIKRLATVTHPEALNNQPTWSPDGQMIAFDVVQWDPSDSVAVGWLVAVVPAGGGQVRRITTFEMFMAHPDWSPNGQELVVSSYDIHDIPSTDQPSNLYTMKPDGSDLRQLTHSSVGGTKRIGQPRWSPDGTQIVVSVGLSEAPGTNISDAQLGFVSAGGGEPALLAPTIHGSQPDLRPTG
jgi:Tol biopolymer transport system component